MGLILCSYAHSRLSLMRLLMLSQPEYHRERLVARDALVRLLALVAPDVLPVVGPVSVRLHAVWAAIGAVPAMDGGHVALEVLSGGAPPRAEHARELLHTHVEAVLVVLQKTEEERKPVD